MKKVLPLLCMLLLSLATEAQTVSFTLTQQPCNNNGILTANFTGLTTPITVNWYFAFLPPVTHTVNSPSDVLNNWSGETVWVTAIDANNQTAYSSYSSPPFNINVATVPANCPTPGSATATITGGASPYTYQWINLSTLATVGTTNPASLPSGGYKLVVTDANGCTFSNDSIQVANNSPFSVALSSTNASCTNGTVTVTGVTAGTPPYSYLWTNGATTQNIANLVMGSYGVTVTDANGCQTSNYVYLSQTPTIMANVTSTPATCIQTNGSLTAFGSGGVPPYSYAWSNNVNTQSQSGVTAGMYMVTVTDANGCTGTGYGAVANTTPINATYTTVASSCTASNGSATLTVTGGAAPYTITWGTFPAQTGTTASNLAPGTYSFNIVDANGCVRSGSVNIPPVNVITATLSATPASCTAANGSLSVSASGGATPYTYSWSNGGTTATINSIAAGNYSVVITDNAGCSVTKSANLSSTSPVTLGFSTTQASCVYNNDGATTVVATGGTSPYTYSWTNGGSTATINNLLTGNYWATVTDANGCTASNMVYVPYNPSGNSCYCTITGTVYHDQNNNCVQDPLEPGIPNIQIHCSGFGYTYTNANGVYSFKVPTGSYTISESVLAFYPLASCQNNNIAQNVTASSGCTQTINFANVTSPIHDMHISTWDYNLPVPGFNYNMVTLISNMGTSTESTIIGGIQTDNQLSVPAFTPSSVFTGSNNWYSISSGNLSLAPGTTQAVGISYTVPANIPLNTGLVFKDSVVHQGPISNWLNDYSPWNNVNYFTSSTVGSFDPNFKEVLPKGTGANGLISVNDSVLEYMVHFQNVGNYYAQKVVVKDTLDADLDWASMRPVYQSHPCAVTMDENGIVTFTFNNINLPAENQNPMGSNGMLTYTIKTKKNLTLGTQFTNKAGIYFDYNEPVITNTTLNTLGAPQSIPGAPGAGAVDFAIYPNPANTQFYLNMNAAKSSAATIDITEVSGKTMAHQQVQLQAGNNNINISAHDLAAGMYFVTLRAEGKTQTKKLVIIK